MTTVHRLRVLANGMPYRHQATRSELIAWLQKYQPHILTTTLTGVTERQETRP